MKIHAIITAVLAAAAVAVPAALQAQVEVRVIHRGLLGVVTESVAGEAGPRQRILDVVPGSPAAEAGLRRGDVVITVDGAPATEQVMRAPRNPGDRVVLRVRRGEEERDYTVVAAERSVQAHTITARMLPDSVLREIAVIMENVRTEVDSLVFQRGVHIPRIDAEGNVTIHFGGDSARVFRFGADSTRVFRFGTGTDSMRVFRFDSDSLRALLPRGDSLRALWSFGGDSVRGIWSFREAGPGMPEEFRARILHSPGARDSLNALIIEGFARGAPLHLDSMPMMPRPGEIFASGITIGMRAVAGAELSELNPDLAEYFGVAGGVLVLNAREGTPAARAGIRAGDVIVRVNDTAVSSIADIRRATDARPGATMQLRVLRRGQPLDVTIGRE